jgi:WD40 repeat protein
MAGNLISAKVSAEVLKFKPGGPPATFEVTVINESEQFASFHLEVIAAGANPNPGFLWYSLSPEVSSKKPPGDSTKFYVAIEDSPVPGFAGMMNLTVRIFSVELRDEEREVLRLFVEEGVGSKLLQLELPVKKFQASLGQLVEVPVRVRNPNQQTANVVLSFLGVKLSWLVNGAEQRFKLDPGGQKEVTFSCQPSSDITQAPCEVYPFTIEATHHKGAFAREQGTLEVLPTGCVKFSCTPQQHTIPPNGGWLPPPQSDPVTYELLFENASNLSSSASAKLLDKDRQKCNLEINPSETDLTPGETSKLLLIASKRRPRLGLPQKLLFNVTGVLSDQRIELQNDTQALELRVRPIIPLWLQAGIVLALVVLLFLLWQGMFRGHTEAVTSVRFNGVADWVISGSDDQTIRSWNVKGNSLKSAEEFARMEKAVRVVRYKPVNNDLVAAGLENGEIYLWDVLGNRGKFLDFFVNQKDDRVLALEFTTNSRYLFSGHGSGAVLQWNIQQDLSANSPQRDKLVNTQRLDFAVYALAMVGDGDKNLAIAGRFNKLMLWNFTSNNSRPRSIPYRESGGQDDYIQSLTVAANKPYLMATADNQGYITLWDMRQCLVENVQCNVLDEWDTGHGRKPVRSVSLSKDGCYLASAGDDKREMLWPLTLEGDREPKFFNGIEIGQFPPKIFSTTINDVDLILREKDILVVSGSDDHQVRLRSVRKSDTACSR